jgi:hypothetical protein
MKLSKAIVVLPLEFSQFFSASAFGLCLTTPVQMTGAVNGRDVAHLRRPEHREQCCRYVRLCEEVLFLKHSTEDTILLLPAFGRKCEEAPIWVKNAPIQPSVLGLCTSHTKMNEIVRVRSF